jgi:hypothetical protein
MKIKGGIKYLFLILTAGIIIFQLGWTAKLFSGYVRNKIWPDRSLDAISRSADVAYGSEYLAFIDFVRKITPPDAVLVNTRTFGAPQYDDIYFLQYFLIPRKVTIQSDNSCPGISSLKLCLGSLQAPNKYFLYGPNFAVSSSVPSTLKVLPFNAYMGLLAPQDSGSGQ